MTVIPALNSAFVDRAAGALAARSKGSPEHRIRVLHQLVFGREPTQEEVALGLYFVAARTEAATPESSGEDRETADAWPQYAHVLLMTNELMFVD